MTDSYNYTENKFLKIEEIVFRIKIPTQIKLPKKYLPNFRTQKNPGIENFKPKKILGSSPSLEIPSTPRR